VVESVLQKGVVYTGTENILGETYAVKYVPLKDRSGEVLGMWFVGMPKSNIGSKDSQILIMRIFNCCYFRIVRYIGLRIVNALCKEVFKRYRYHKVSFLESNSSGNKTQRKVVMLSLFLIGTFFLIWLLYRLHNR